MRQEVSEEISLRLNPDSKEAFNLLKTCVDHNDNENARRLLSAGVIVYPPTLNTVAELQVAATPLTIAAHHGNLELIKEVEKNIPPLATDNHAKNIRQHMLNAALVKAVEAGQLPAAELLINLKADIHTVANDDMLLAHALRHVSDKFHTTAVPKETAHEMMAFLLEVEKRQFPDAPSKLVAHADNYGNNILHKIGRAKMSRATYTILTEAGADPKKPNARGDLPPPPSTSIEPQQTSASHDAALLAAVRELPAHRVKEELQAGANPNTFGPDGNASLHLAVLRAIEHPSPDATEILQLLLDHRKTNVLLENNYGRDGSTAGMIALTLAPDNHDLNDRIATAEQRRSPVEKSHASWTLVDPIVNSTTTSFADTVDTRRPISGNRIMPRGEVADDIGNTIHRNGDGQGRGGR